MFELASLVVGTVMTALITLAVFAKNKRSATNVLFIGLALGLIGWSVTTYLSLHARTDQETLCWIRFTMLFVVIQALSFLLLVRVFPAKRFNVFKYKKYIAAIVYAVVVAGVTISPYLFIDFKNGSPVPGPGMALFLPFALLFVVGGLIALIIRYKRAHGVEKAQLQYFLAGTLCIFTLIPLGNFIMPLVFKRNELVALSPLYSIVFSGLIAYGIVAKRMFDVRFIIARFIAYLLLLLFAGVLYGFSAVAVSFVVTGVKPNMAQITLSTVVVGIFILLVQPLRRFFNHITRVVFYQNDYDTKHVLDQLASVLVRSTNTDILAKSSMTILKNSLQPEYVAMLLLKGEDKDESRVISVGQGVPSLTEMVSVGQLHTVTDIVSIDSIDVRAGSLHEKIKATNVSVIARLKTKGSIIGYCFFGYKTSGSTYTTRDIDLIRITSDELAVAIQNTMRFEQIQDFNATLQGRIEAATKKLRDSNAQLQKLDEAKDEFVSMASHQLRTPLTSVKGYISMVLEGDAGKITKMQRQLLEEAFTSSERMVHLINDFLNVSRLQTGKFLLELKPVDLAKVVEQEVNSLQTTAGAHQMKLTYRSPAYFPILYIDDSKIRQVLMNFMDNAIYYSRENTTITVKLAVEDGYAVATVHDTGIGVPKSEQAHLFTKFFRATNARKQRPDGTGVGLFLAKKVIDAHGGSIIFESVEGEGSTFGFRLPIKKLSVAPKQAD